MDRFNRFLFGLLGLLLLLAGVLGLLAAGGLLPAEQPGAVYERVVGAAQAQPGVWWAGLALAGVLLLVLGLLLLRGQLRRPSGGGLHGVTVESSDRGRTTVQTVAVARAIAGDLRRLPGVTGSEVRIVGAEEDERVLADLDLGADADLATVREAADDAYARVADALGREDLAAETRLRPTGQQPARVR